MGEPHTNSYYAATLNTETNYPELTESVTCDVAVIGGGFSGVATSLTLAERGYDVVLLEQNRIGWGASGRNGGQLIHGVGGTTRIRKRLGKEVDDLLWDMCWLGHDVIEERVEKYGIECDFKHGYMDVAIKPRHMRGLEEDYEEFQNRGMSGDGLRIVSREELPELIGTDAYIGGLINNRNGHLHPLNLCIGEARAAQGLGAHFAVGLARERVCGCHVGEGELV